MQGIEEAELFFRNEALPVLEQNFPELLPGIAAGMAGRGSECFGFDDEISRDHDFTAGFTIWLEKEDVSMAMKPKPPFFLMKREKK